MTAHTKYHLTISVLLLALVLSVTALGAEGPAAPPVPPVRTITLDEAHAIALKQNPSISTIRERVPSSIRWNPLLVTTPSIPARRSRICQ